VRRVERTGRAAMRLRPHGPSQHAAPVPGRQAARACRGCSLPAAGRPQHAPRPPGRHDTAGRPARSARAAEMPGSGSPVTRARARPAVGRGGDGGRARSGRSPRGPDRALVVVVPANPVADTVRGLDHLEDHALAGRLAHPLRLDDDPVPDPRGHPAPPGIRPACPRARPPDANLDAPLPDRVGAEVTNRCPRPQVPDHMRRP
jgi:hypothetical protein